jgi:hypothetical protein
MSERYNIQRHHARGLRPESYSIQFTNPTDAPSTTPRFPGEGEARQWAERYLTAKDAGQIQAARAATPPVPEPAPRQARSTAARQVHRQAAQVASLLGLPMPAATTGCYYCGLPLRNGQCGECG